MPPPPGLSLFKQRGAELIKKVYEADPLACPRCEGAMRIFIDQPDVIEKFLPHLVPFQLARQNTFPTPNASHRVSASCVR